MFSFPHNMRSPISSRARHNSTLKPILLHDKSANVRNRGRITINQRLRDTRRREDHVHKVKQNLGILILNSSHRRTGAHTVQCNMVLHIRQHNQLDKQNANKRPRTRRPHTSNQGKQYSQVHTQHTLHRAKSSNVIQITLTSIVNLRPSSIST